MNRNVALPDFQISRIFALTAGDEYQVPTERLNGMVRQLFPSELKFTPMRLGDFVLVGIPGETAAKLGLEIKAVFRERKILNPAVIRVADDYVGYILSKEEYLKGGYEAAVSFYGESLGGKKWSCRLLN